MRFAKMHGIGNDFIVIDETEMKRDSKYRGADHYRGLSHALFPKDYCRRRFSIGADGVLYIVPPKNKAADFDFIMEIRNPDGSRAETCVNGLRCAALYWHLIKGKPKKMKIYTTAGIVDAEIFGVANGNGRVKITLEHPAVIKGKATIEIDGKKYEYAEVDVGNPHAVIFMESSVDEFPVEEIGHKISYHKNFPNGTNTEFVNVISDTRLKMRVHERGACETQACGSGSIAIVKAAAENGVVKRDSAIEVEQPGGTLKIKLGDKIELEGEAEIVFVGELNVV
ncbi:MAG: diaminopimelate epimerase [Candidatus Diapherotrites archaeon]